MVECIAQPINFKVATLTGKTMNFSMIGETTLEELSKQIALKEGMPQEEISFIFNQEKIVDLN